VRTYFFIKPLKQFPRDFLANIYANYLGDLQRFLICGWHLIDPIIT